MKRVVVTGGAGFIGSNLVDELISNQYEVIILDNLSTGKSANINPQAKFIYCHLQEISENELINLFTGVDIIFHTAALARVQPSIEHPKMFNKANVDSTLNVLLAAHKAGVKRVVYSASSSCYGSTSQFPTPEDSPTNPLSPYGLQKYIGEQYCRVFSQVYGLDTVSLRYFNVYGERQSLEGAYKLVLGIFAKQRLENKPLTITNDGNQRRDFTYVKDVVQANILAAQYKNNLNGESFNIGNGDNCSINEVAEMIGGSVEYIGTRLEPFETLADNTKAKKILGWVPQGNLRDWIKQYKIQLGI